MVDLSDFTESKYKLKYKCHICNKIVPFEIYYLTDCNVNKYVKCGYYNCRYCANRTCYNAHYSSHCYECNPHSLLFYCMILYNII